MPTTQFPFLLIFAILTILSHQRRQNFTNYQVSPYNVDQKWQEIYDILGGDPVEELVFTNVIVCEQGLRKILNMQGVRDSLRTLVFQRVHFSQELARIVWQTVEHNPLINNISIVDANLRNSDIQLLPTTKQLPLKHLSLQGNMLGAQAFAHLSKLQLPHLTHLNFYGLSIVDEESVGSFLKMNLSKLERLNVGYTAISGDGMLTILGAVDLAKLVQLNISKNNFEQGFYKNFTQFNFGSLETLDISNLLIDQDGIKYFKDKQFPNLTKLSIGGNQIFLQGMYTFLNKKNYPKLDQLIIGDDVIFEEAFFAYFGKEFQGVRWRRLEFVGDGIEPSMFKHLQRLDLTLLKKFTIKRGFISPQLFYQFLAKNQFKELVELDLQYMINFGDVLQKVMQKSWPKLKIMKIGRVGQIDFTKLQQLVKEIRFPVLQNLVIDVRNYNAEQIEKLIYIISKTWSKLIQLQIIVTSHEKITRKMATGLLSKVDKQIYLNIKTIKLDPFQIEVQPRFLGMLNPNGKITVSQFNYYKTIQEQFKDIHLDPPFDSKFDRYFEQASPQYFNAFNFQQLILINQNQNCSLLAFLAKNQEKKGKKCQLPYTIVFKSQSITNKCYQTFNKCLFPNLRSLQLSFSDKFLSNETNFKLMSQNFSQIEALQFQNQNNIPNSQIIGMFKRQKFDCLSTIYFFSSDMKSQQIETILTSSPGLSRVTNLYIVLSRVRDLTFVTKLNLTLKSVAFSAEMIGDKVSDIANINYQFMTSLALGGDGITNQNLIEFLDKMPKKKGPSFPKVTRLSFKFNNIETSGTKKLLEAGFPMVQNIEMYGNKDPEIINTMLSSNSHRLDDIMIYRNEENSIDPNLNPKSTRQLRNFFIQTANLQSTDFKAFSNMEFHALKRVIIIFTRIFQCESLKHILKIAKTVKRFSVEFREQASLANSECLSGEAKSDESMKHISWLTIQNQSPIRSNLRKFFDLLIFDQVLQILAIQGVYPSEKAMRRLTIQANLQYLQYLNIRQNDLTDQMVQQLLNRDFKQLSELLIGQNQRLTSNAIKYMANRTYPQLQKLQLSHTSIDDQGIKTLLSCKFPALQYLSITNTEITGNALKLLTNLHAPFLNKLDISSNNIKYADMRKFDPSKFLYLNEIILLPYMTAEEYEKLSQLFNEGRAKESKVEIRTDLINIQKLEQEEDIFDGGNN